MFDMDEEEEGSQEETFLPVPAVRSAASVQESVPGTPDVSEAAAVPETPEAPEVTDVPEAEDVPEVPDVPEAKDVLEVPDVPGAEGQAASGVLPPEDGLPWDKRPEAEPEPEEEEEEEETYEYTEGQVRGMREAFRVYDRVQNNTIPVSRLGCVLRSLGLNPTERELHAAARWLGPGGLVRFKEFLIIMGRALKQAIGTPQVLDGFRSLDDWRQGTVPRERLQSVLTGSGEAFYPEEFNAFIKYADIKKKGVVKYEEFVLRMEMLAASGGATKKRKKKGSKKGKRKKKKREADSSSNFSSSDVLSMSS